MMKVFLDTNVFLEYFEQRRECQAVGKLLSAVEDGKLKAIVSVGCVYTLAYLIRMELKRKDIHRPEQTLRLRTMLNTVMSMVTVGGLNQSRIVKGLNDVAFDDVEDSFQYQCGLQAKCDALNTINLRDYNNADTSKMEILSPTEFVEKYL
jgi:predicted nucleic acid-binding protein